MSSAGSEPAHPSSIRIIITGSSAGSEPAHPDPIPVITVPLGSFFNRHVLISSELLRCRQVVLNWFWGDVQRELSVGGDVVQPARTWGLHATCLLVKGLEAESSPTQYAEVQDMLKYLSGVVELLEAHFLAAWMPLEGHGSRRELPCRSSTTPLSFLSLSFDIGW